jgi:hypothetical protein
MVCLSTKYFVGAGEAAVKLFPVMVTSVIAVPPTIKLVG